VVSFFTKGWAPYTLRWSARVLSATRPTHLELEAFGDLQGRGVWAIEAKSPGLFLADLVALIASLGVVVPEIDR